MKKSQPPTAFSASRFASLIGADRHHLVAKLRELEAVPVSSDGRSEQFSIRDLVAAHCGGDQKAETLRKTRAEAERLEIANSRARGEMVEILAVKRLGEKVMIAVRNRILNMPLTDEEKDECLRELKGLESMDWSR